MTKDIKYLCNFCRNVLNDGAEIRGIIWKANNKEINVVSKQQAENHLCDTCINAIKAATTTNGEGEG